MRSFQSRLPRRLLAAIAIALVTVAAIVGGHRLLAARPAADDAPIRFEDVTEAALLAAAGSRGEGRTYGAYWGDANGDGAPDLYQNHHLCVQPSLYLNQGDGTLVDRGAELLQPPGQCADMHGAMWADFDNDGDRDLVQLVGSDRGRGNARNPALATRLFVNQGNALVDRAADLGVEYPLARGRSPLWFDPDSDGDLDLFVGCDVRPDGKAPPALFVQDATGQFARSPLFDRADFAGARFAAVAGIASPEPLQFALFPPPEADTPLASVYATEASGFSALTDELTFTVSPGPGWRPALSGFVRRVAGRQTIQPWRELRAGAEDAVFADFDGDAIADLYVAGNAIDDEVVRVEPQKIAFALGAREEEKGFDVPGASEIRLDLPDGLLAAQQLTLRVGASGRAIATFPVALSPADPEVRGILPHRPGEDRGAYLGYDASSQRWQVRLSSPERGRLTGAISGDRLGEPEPVGTFRATPGRTLVLAGSAAGRFTANKLARGLEPVPTQNVAAGDFDNDMDVDLYLVTAGAVSNRPNRLYQNQGNGQFVAVPEAGGAAGTTEGVGDAVAVADYDRDGFLDLLVANGRGAPQLAGSVPLQLFRNRGNANHWLEIDLVGTASNRDAIGARVLVTAGGVTQLREQSGGMHHHAQDFSRLHFGLGEQTVADRVAVTWPSGRVQRLDRVPADELLVLTEPTS